MKAFLILFASTFLFSQAHAGDNEVVLQCSTGGNNAYAMSLNGDTGELDLFLFSNLDYGTFPQVNSDNQDTLTFHKSPKNINNGNPFRIEIPVEVLQAPTSTYHMVNVRVTQGYPGPIDENKFHTYKLKCLKVRKLLF